MPVMLGDVFCTEQNFKDACSQARGEKKKNYSWVPKGLETSLA